MNAAGITITTPDGLALFLKRGAGSDHAGTWAWPAGGIEDGETAEQAARREATEEIGYSPEGELSELDHKEDDQGAFTTFHHGVDDHFLPRLNSEHTAYAWAPLTDPPSPLHPGVAETIEKIRQADMAEDVGTTETSYAFDRASVRGKDADDRLHVDVTNISKANVCPYLGREIPDFVNLGLKPDTIYKLYRDPEELEKAAPTFNRLPVLSKHVEVTAADHRPDLLIGTTGSEARFEHPYLRNSLAVWTQEAIDDVESERKKELSSAYRYRADMTSGTSPEGEDYDGVMRDIIGNHVALVEEGRAGPDVVVGDSTEELNKMKVSQKAMMVRGVLAAFIAPRLAADAKMPSLTSILLGVNAKNFAEKKPTIIDAVNKATKGILAKDASTEGLVALLNGLEGAGAAPTDEGAPEDDVVLDAPVLDDPGTEPLQPPNPMDAVKSFLEGKLSPEDMAEIEKLCTGGATDDPPPFKGMPETGGTMVGDKDPTDKDDDMKIDKPAMDAAIDKARKETLAEATKTAREIREAERAVRPYVGEVTQAFDSASDVYKSTLEALKVDIKDVDPSAYSAMLKLVPVPGTKTPVTISLGMDAASSADFDKRFPTASRIGAL